MKSAGVLALVVLVAFVAPAYSARGPARSLISSGDCLVGNIQDSEVTCPGGYKKCFVDAIAPGGTATATCEGGVTATVSFSADKEEVTFTVDGKVVTNIIAYIKGGNAYCYYTGAPYDTPFLCGNAGNRQRCGFSHAVFCVLPCDCEAKIQAALDAANPAFDAAGYCPGSTLPDVDITACGPITAKPATTSTCSGKVLYTAKCPGSSVEHTSEKTYVVSDSNFAIFPNPGGCPSATSKCLPTTGATTTYLNCAVDSTTCKVTVTYTITGACDKTGTGTITYNG